MLLGKTQRRRMEKKCISNRLRCSAFRSFSFISSCVNLVICSLLRSLVSWNCLTCIGLRGMGTDEIIMVKLFCFYKYETLFMCRFHVHQNLEFIILTWLSLILRFNFLKISLTKKWFVLEESFHLNKREKKVIKTFVQVFIFRGWMMMYLSFESYFRFFPHDKVLDEYEKKCCIT